VEVADARVADRSETKRRLSELIEQYFAAEPADEGTNCPLSVPLYGAEEVTAALDVLLSQNVTMGARV